LFSAKVPGYRSASTPAKSSSSDKWWIRCIGSVVLHIYHYFHYEVTVLRRLMANTVILRTRSMGCCVASSLSVSSRWSGKGCSWDKRAACTACTCHSSRAISARWASNCTVYAPLSLSQRLGCLTSPLSLSHFGGRPRRFPRPVARVSRHSMAAASTSRSAFNSAMIRLRFTLSRLQEPGDVFMPPR